MDIRQSDELKSIKSRIVDGMLSYMAVADVDYTQMDVEQCVQILEDYTDAISDAKDRSSAIKAVKSAVLKLNRLNESAGYELIETDQREDICEYIIKAGALLGFNEKDEDVTEEWREW